MTYFAEIKNGKVVRVIVATQEVIDRNYTGEWVETKMDNSIRKQYAGIGMSYNQGKNKFISKQPFPSWALDINDDWQSPAGSGSRSENTPHWNEAELKWEL